MTLTKPPRLERVFEKYDPPLYFVTFCTKDRARELANDSMHSVFVEYGRRGVERKIALGRYVIMPDHVHLFIRGSIDFNLGLWVRGLKRVVAAAGCGGRVPLWQHGFFDHIIRNSESYSQKWDYVRLNPVRAGLVQRADEWPFQGELVAIEHR
jgi:putative transposase